MLIQSVTCDNCGVQKKESNHWFTVTKDGEGIIIRRMHQEDLSEEEQHICGETCLEKTILKMIPDLK